MNQQNNNTGVSIIMPAYNAEKYIAASIESVLAQTFLGWELIVIDDGSTDATAVIVKQFTVQNNKIKYIYQSNAKQAAARNNGIKNANFDIIAFLDADDLWLPNKLEYTLSFFNADKYDLVFTNTYYSDAFDIDISSTFYDDFQIADAEYFGESALKLFIGANRIPILTALVKKDVLVNVGLFDIDCVPAEDYDLWIRLLKNGSRFLSIHQKTAIYRIQNNSSTAADRYATSAVLKLLIKNFTRDEFKKLEVQAATKEWLVRWINSALTNRNSIVLQNYLYHLNNSSPITTCIIANHTFFTFKIFKRLIRRWILLPF